MSGAALPPYPDGGRPASGSKVALATKVEHLAAVPLFAGCSKRQLRPLARSSRHELVEADQPLITEGSASLEAFLIIAGSAVVRRNGRKVAELGPGDIAGELGLLLHRPRRSSVRTTTPVECLVLDRQALRQAVNEVPGLGWALLQTVAAHLPEA